MVSESSAATDKPSPRRGLWAFFWFLCLMLVVLLLPSLGQILPPVGGKNLVPLLGILVQFTTIGIFVFYAAKIYRSQSAIDKEAKPAAGTSVALLVSGLCIFVLSVLVHYRIDVPTANIVISIILLAALYMSVPENTDSSANSLFGRALPIATLVSLVFLLGSKFSFGFLENAVPDYLLSYNYFGRNIITICIFAFLTIAIFGDVFQEFSTNRINMSRFFEGHPRRNGQTNVSLNEEIGILILDGVIWAKFYFMTGVEICGHFIKLSGAAIKKISKSFISNRVVGSIILGISVTIGFLILSFSPFLSNFVIDDRKGNVAQSSLLSYIVISLFCAWSWSVSYAVSVPELRGKNIIQFIRPITTTSFIFGGVLFLISLLIHAFVLIGVLEWPGFYVSEHWSQAAVLVAIPVLAAVFGNKAFLSGFERFFGLFGLIFLLICFALVASGHGDLSSKMAHYGAKGELERPVQSESAQREEGFFATLFGRSSSGKYGETVVNLESNRLAWLVGKWGSVLSCAKAPILIALAGEGFTIQYGDTPEARRINSEGADYVQTENERFSSNNGALVIATAETTDTLQRCKQ